MIKTDLKEVGAIELIEHLQEVERCSVEVGTYDFGFSLLFTAVTTATPSISNMETIAEWAKVHRHTIRVGYNEYKEAIVVNFKRLLPDEEYSEDEKLTSVHTI